ncbi:MAG: FCD domain-containing protein [Rhodobacteraceae bacterium HLUCCA24]|nr:MAG: FCD domain-containing protein [Rhodobacteraceae bacterium HLUCCA24]
MNSVARSEVEQLFAVRSEVLALMGKYAARNITEEEIAQFRAAVDGLEQQFAAEPEDVVRFYLASHRCWTVVARASKARTINHINSMITSSPIWQIAVRDRLGEQGMRSTGEGLIANWNGFYDSVVARDETAASDRARTITMVTWKLIRDTFGDDQP